VASIPVFADTRTRVQNVLRHSGLPYAETLENVGFMHGSYCRIGAVCGMLSAFAWTR